jgi:hypothetical protein
MFNCDGCHRPTGPRISPIHDVTNIRRVVYEVVKDEQHVQVPGVEIVSTVKLCATCAGVKAALPKVAKLDAPASSLEERVAAPGKFNVVGRVVEAMLRRTAHQSKRANSDFQCTYPLLKAYELRGGSL